MPPRHRPPRSRAFAAGIALVALMVPVTALAQERPTGGLALAAVFAGDDRILREGLIWRIYALDGETPRLVQRSELAEPVITLPPGNYMIHVGYGLAAATRRVVVGQRMLTERVPIHGGALSVAGKVGSVAIAAEQQRIAVHLPSGGLAEGRLIADRLPPGQALRLPEGNYVVVSTLADSNSVVRADIRVPAGTHVQATLNHRAATVTLKLVSQPGGEARANTAWSVLTPGGDVLREALGAFPTMTLAEGEYVAVARHGGQVFQHEFRVRSGIDAEVEVLAERPLNPHQD